MIVCYCVCAGLAGLYWFVAAMQNKKKAAGVLDQTATVGVELTDATDYQQSNFHYIT